MFSASYFQPLFRLSSCEFSPFIHEVLRLDNPRAQDAYHIFTSHLKVSVFPLCFRSRRCKIRYLGLVSWPISCLHEPHKVRIALLWSLYYYDWIAGRLSTRLGYTWEPQIATPITSALILFPIGLYSRSHSWPIPTNLLASFAISLHPLLPGCDIPHTDLVRPPGKEFWKGIRGFFFAYFLRHQTGVHIHDCHVGYC